MNSDLTMGLQSPTEEDITQTGFLQYAASVSDVKIGHDRFTEVYITPEHHLSNVFVR